MFKLLKCLSHIKEISTNVMTKTYVILLLTELLVGSDQTRNKSMIGDHDFEVTRLHENYQLIHLSLIDPNKVIKIKRVATNLHNTPFTTITNYIGGELEFNSLFDGKRS